MLPVQPRLGRLPAADPRDERYPARALLAAPAERQYRYWYNQGARLDQGDTGTCVAHAWVHLAENSPITRPGTLSPYQLYRELILVDEWYDNDHEAGAADADLLFGSSVRAGAKAMAARGLIGQYSWAWDADTAVDWVLLKSPVVLGTNWYGSMFDPDAEGFVTITPYTTIVGGHAFIMDGANRQRGIVRCLNSWGPTWGRGGMFYMDMELLQRLITEDGEACMPVELKA